MYRDIARAYAAARRRLLLLDYDGTLVDLAPTPPEAKPTAQVIDVLTRLGNDPHNTVVIVSGRDCQTLDAWLGSLPIHLVAEHGGFTKQRGQPWKTAMPTDNQWKKQLRPIMETSVSAVPRSFVEEKAIALVWHYRLAEQATASQEALTLVKRLQPAAKKHGLIITPGNNIIEARPKEATKAKAAELWLPRQPWDFIVAAGDDTTDEDLLKAVPRSAYTIKIGAGTSVARYHLQGPHALLQLLKTCMVQSRQDGWAVV